MIPNFALSLSFDGIALLQRVPDGWHLVGEVPLDVPDLKAALADLRRTAVRIAPDGLRTKLVIPGDQIRFMSLDTDQASQSDVETALEGTTPYTLDELVIDFTRNGGQTHIAAVARETLDEAEAFAREHGFDPVACVAVPEPGTFATEVFLTALGGSGAVRDDRPVRQTGTVRLPAEPAKTPEAGTASATADATPPDVEPQTKAAPVAMAGPVAKAPDGDAAEAPRKDDTPVFASRSKVAAPALKGAAQDAKPDTAMAAAALPGGVAPARLREAMDKAETASQQAAPTITAVRARVAGAGMPSGGQGGIATSPAATPAAPDRKPRITPDVPSRTSAPAVVGAPEARSVPAPDTEPSFTRRKEPPPPLVGKGRAASTTAMRATTQSDAPVSALTAAAAPPQAPAPVATTPTARVPDVAPMVAADRKTRIPAASPTTVPPAVSTPRGKPRFLGLILTVILLVVLLLIGLWASTLPPGGIAGWFRGSATDDAVAASDLIPSDAVQMAAAASPQPAVTDAAPVAEPVITAAVAPAIVADQPTVTEVQPVSAARAPAGRVLTPDEANRIYAATGVYQRAPRIAVTPRSATLEGVGPIAVVAAPPVVPQPLMPTLAAAEPDALIAAQPIPPGPNDTFERDARGNILATPEGTVTPQGAVVFAGAPDLRPVIRPGTPNAPPAAAMTPPVAPVARPDGLAATVIPAQAATAAPPIRPVLRPQSAAPATSAAANAAPLPPYTGTRPKLRPASLIPPAAVAIAAYTGTRPVLRPAGIAPPATQETTPEEVAPTPVADISAVAAAIAAAAPRSSFTNRTALAVSIIPRPAPRPRNFAQVVARTRTVAPPPAAAAPAAPTRTAAVAATPAPPTIVAPSGNVPGGVARAATIDKAMNMRQMNLVGVYGKPNARRALVRLGNGRYVKVEVGSRLDGGQVTAIGDTALNFVKRGKTYALTLPG